MANWTTLPHENLVAYQVAHELVVIVREAKITDSKLRDQALRAATSVCLNIAEAAGRISGQEVTAPQAPLLIAAARAVPAAGWRQRAHCHDPSPSPIPSPATSLAAQIVRGRRA